MLHEVITAKREEILELAWDKGSDRPDPPPRPGETKHGASLFLDQLVEALRLSLPGSPELGKSAARHGEELWRRGFTLAQVVHEYDDLGEAILEHVGPIPSAELHILMRCLGNATARAVSEYAEQRDRGITGEWTERFSALSHDLRNQIFSALIAFDEIKEGGLGEDGSVGAVLHQSLLRLGERLDHASAEVRTDARRRSERPSAAPRIAEEASALAPLGAGPRNLHLAVDPASAEIVGPSPAIAQELLRAPDSHGEGTYSRRRDSADHRQPLRER